MMKKSHWIIFGIVVTLFALWSFSPLAAKDTAKAKPKLSTKERIEEIKTRLAEQKRLQKEARAQEADIMTRLDKIEDRLVEIDKNMLELSAEQEFLQPLVDEATNILAAVERDLSYRQFILARRIRETYKRGRYQRVSVLVSARDVQDLTRRVRFLLAMAGEDRRQARAVAARRAEAAERKAELDLEKANLDELAQIATDERRDLLDTKNSRAGALARIRGDKESYAKLIAKLEGDKSELEQLLAGKTSRTVTGKVKKRTGKAPPVGSVRMPARGRLVREFGLEKGMYGTVTRNEGIDIAAPAGTEIQSVLAGRVIFADWFRSYGQMVIIDHGRGFVTIYAHCSKILVEKDSAVAEGQTIALVGDTGTLGETLLYFEARVDNKAIDPWSWLKSGG